LKYIFDVSYLTSRASKM